MMALGTCAALPCIALQWYARGFPASAAAVGGYYAAFLASMMALNFIYAAAAGLIPDLVPPEQARGCAQLPRGTMLAR